MHFIALKNPSPQPGLNPQTLCPMVRTPTITPLRRLTGPYLKYGGKRLLSGSNLISLQCPWLTLGSCKVQVSPVLAKIGSDPITVIITRLGHDTNMLHLKE
jgi:hypothetical protein